MRAKCFISFIIPSRIPVFDGLVHLWQQASFDLSIFYAPRLSGQTFKFSGVFYVSKSETKKP